MELVESWTQVVSRLMRGLGISYNAAQRNDATEPKNVERLAAQKAWNYKKAGPAGTVGAALATGRMTPIATAFASTMTKALTEMAKPLHAS